MRVRFKQISANSVDLFALDKNGNVWRFTSEGRWKPLTMYCDPHYENDSSAVSLKSKKEREDD